MLPSAMLHAQPCAACHNATTFAVDDYGMSCFGYLVNYPPFWAMRTTLLSTCKVLTGPANYDVSVMQEMQQRLAVAQNAMVCSCVGGSSPMGVEHESATSSLLQARW